MLVTGAASFIGNSLVLELLRTVEPIRVVGIDIMSDYNPVEMKEWRLEQIKKESEKHPDSFWTFVKGDIADACSLCIKRKHQKQFGTDARLSLIWMRHMAKFLPMNSLLKQTVSVWLRLPIQ